MALLGMFEKKYCDICGEKIGLLGNRKLNDGNLCKNCAAKLSPFFSDRRQSTVEEIRKQLEYRENNRSAVAAFHTTRTFGTGMKLMVDEANRKFVVTSSSNLTEANPDVLSFDQVTGCDYGVEQSTTEMKFRTPDGQMISYQPAQYSTSYIFKVVISVNHPYFDEISFRLNNVDVKLEPSIRVGPLPTPIQPKEPNKKPIYTPIRVLRSVPAIPEQDINYKRFMSMAEEVVALFSAARQTNEGSAAIEAGMQPPVMTPSAGVVVCPYCGCATNPDAAGCCEHCGAPVNG